MIIVAFATGAALIYVGMRQDEKIALSPRSLPSDIAKIDKLQSESAAKTRELEIAKQQLDAAGQQLSALQPAPPTAAQHSLKAPQSTYLAEYNLSLVDIANLRDEVFKVRNFLPSHITIQTADDGEARRVANSLSKAIGFAGIDTSGMSVGYPVTPQETGISIRVADLGKIPDGAKRLVEAIKKIIGSEPRYTATAMPVAAPDAFILFVETNPKEN